VRSCLATFGDAAIDAAAGHELAAFSNGARPAQIYQVVAIAAATIRWASHETGRSEYEILDELEKNYTH
jgi:hypothetical protein